jgi:hypothetical protein
MFKKIFALALVLVLVALCTRRPFDVRTGEVLPTTCAKAQFAAAVEELDGVAADSESALARIEVLPRDEPAEYVRRWKQERDGMRELGRRADAVRVPRCLAHAREIFDQFLDQSLHAAEIRAPDGDMDDYRRARETAEVIRGQYQGEVRQQEKNRQ